MPILLWLLGIPIPIIILLVLLARSSQTGSTIARLWSRPGVF